MDVWGKQKTPGSVYYDITWMGYLGARFREKYRESFLVSCAEAATKPWS